MIIGIDPGLKGAIAAISSANEYLAVGDMPVVKPGKSRTVNGAELSSIIKELLILREQHGEADLQVIIERVSSSPQQGVVSAFNFGKSAGIVEGVVSAMGLPYELVTPVAWKRNAGLLRTDKEMSRARAIQLWPSAPLARKKDDGRAESLLIARYGPRGD